MERATSEGLLSAWLRRNATKRVPDTVSPTWSEASEGSLDEAIAGASPEQAPQPASTSPPRSISPVQPEKISWLTRLNVAYNTAVRGGAKALQKLTARDRLQDYLEAKDRLERTAGEVEGEARVAMLHRWASLLAELSCMPGPYSNAPLSPGSACSDADWQQLQAGSPIRAPHAEHKAAEADPGLKASEVLYVDWSQPGSEPITFRELFLRSHVLQIITSGYAVHPALEGLKDRDALLGLFAACLGGDAALHGQLAHLVLAASETLIACRKAGTERARCQSISDALARAIAALKHKAEVEVLDRKMGLLRTDIATQAAAAAEAHKFNSGSLEPSGDCTPEKLASGVAATAQVMHLAQKLCQLALQRSALVVGAPQPSLEAALATTRQRLHLLQAALQQAEVKAAETHRQQHEGEATRGRKLADMDTQLAAVQLELTELQAKKAELTAQMMKVDAALASTYGRKAELEEGRNVYEEGISLTLDALQHELDKLGAQQQQDTAESAALVASAAVLSAAQLGHGSWRLAAESAADRIATESAQEYGHAATRHLYFQRGQSQLLMRQLRFCAGELQNAAAQHYPILMAVHAGLSTASASKQEHISQMGMGHLLVDAQTQRHKLQQQYLDAESAALHLFQDITAVQEALSATAHQPRPLASSAGSPLASSAAEPVPAISPEACPAADTLSAPSIILSQELQDLLHSIETIRTSFEERPRPAGLPLPGQPLPAHAALDGRAPAATGVDVGLGQASARVPSSASALHASTLPAELGGVDLPQVTHEQSKHTNSPAAAVADEPMEPAPASGPSAADTQADSTELTDRLSQLPLVAVALAVTESAPSSRDGEQFTDPSQGSMPQVVSEDKTGSDSVDDVGFLPASSGEVDVEVDVTKADHA